MASDKKTVAVVLFGGFELLDVAAPVELFGALGSDVLELCYCRLPDSPEEEAPSYPQHDAHVAGWRECAHICSLPIDEAIAFATPYAFGRPFADYDINREEQAQAREPTPEDLLSSAVSSSCLELRGGSSGPDFVTTHVLSDNGTITSNDGTRFHPNIVFVPGGTGVRSQLENEWLSAWFLDACSSPACEIIFTVCTGSWLLGVSGVLDGLSATCNKAAMRDKSSGPLQWAPNVKWINQARWVEDRSLPGKLVVTSSGVSAGGDAALAVIAELRGRERAREVATQCEWIWQEDPTNDPFSQSTLVEGVHRMRIGDSENTF